MPRMPSMGGPYPGELAPETQRRPHLYVRTVRSFNANKPARAASARGGTRTHSATWAALFKRADFASLPTRAVCVNRTQPPSYPDGSNFAVAQRFYGRRPPFARGSFSSTTRRLRRPSRAFAPAPAAVGRAARRARATREPAGLRGAGRALPGAAAGVLPAHAVLEGGRRGRAAGGVRRRVQRDARRRPADQRASVAVPDRAQPVAQPPAADAGR